MSADTVYNKDLLQKVVALCKRRGFIFPSCEIYGGMANTYDYGPYGVMLKENVRNLWLQRFIRSRSDVHQVESSIILNPKVWESSGHVANFADVMVEDTVNNKRYRADHIIEDFFEAKGEEAKVDGLPAEELDKIIKENNILSPDGNPFGPAKKMNLLFQTEIGIVEGEGSKAYLRGEIAQGIFLNFKNVLDSLSPKLPFGIGQTGKAFRNEITKGQFTFRTLEFDLMEFEYMFDPEDTDWNELFEYWKTEMTAFAKEDIGLTPERIRWREHEETELSHYSKRTEDLEFQYPWGFKESFGLAYRTDFDLKNHAENSGQNLVYTYPDGKKVTPHVIEPSFGLSRLITTVLVDSYRVDEMDGNERIYLDLDPKIAPVKVAILPLVKKPELLEVADKLYDQLRHELSTEILLSGSVGKRYRKMDEIGTPYCITVDYDGLEDGTVTLRHRNTGEQERIKITELKNQIKL